MKKALIFICLFLFPLSVNAEVDLAKNATSAILIEASSGEILFEKNAHEKLAPASMTKMMSMLLIMENIEKGNLKWDEMISVSSNASSMGGSQIFLETGEKMSVEDLLKGIAIGSANDATVALAERIATTEDNFVSMMNDKAKELGLKNTNFKNATGLDSENHYSSAYDMAMIAKELVKHEKILEFSSIYEDYLRKNTDNSFWLVNTNRLVRFYQGLDGLKTGYTQDAGYCLTATAKKDNMRLISVVMKEPDSNTRNNETTTMLDYGFNSYSVDTIINKNNSIGKIKIDLATKREVDVSTVSDVNILNNKNKDEKVVDYKVNLFKIKAPVKKGDVVGNVSIYENNKEIMKMDLTVLEDVDKINIFVAFLRNIENIIIGLN